ncbi:MAG: AAA family ATPase [Armatimonadetes bacterium]|nr:AAA family ATPase [Armatimonadota bacterium]
MRIAVSGKGGSGKTTITATLARTLARQGYCVNAIDDDPNPNLANALGLTPDQIARLRRPPREEILAERVDDEGHRSLKLKRPFDEVLQEYGVCGPDHVGILTMTGLLGAGKG